MLDGLKIRWLMSVEKEVEVSFVMLISLSLGSRLDLSVWIWSSLIDLLSRNCFSKLSLFFLRVFLKPIMAGLAARCFMNESNSMRG